MKTKIFYITVCGLSAALSGSDQFRIFCFLFEWNEWMNEMKSNSSLLLDSRFKLLNGFTTRHIKQPKKRHKMINDHSRVWKLTLTDTKHQQKQKLTTKWWQITAKREKTTTSKRQKTTKRSKYNHRHKKYISIKHKAQDTQQIHIKGTKLRRQM